MRCFGFGIPSVLDADHCERGKPYIHSFIMKNDVIPRIGHVTSIRLREHIKLLVTSHQDILNDPTNIPERMPIRVSVCIIHPTFFFLLLMIPRSQECHPTLCTRYDSYHLL